jgi:hypothetical protein
MFIKYEQYSSKLQNKFIAMLSTIIILVEKKKIEQGKQYQSDTVKSK